MRPVILALPLLFACSAASNGGPVSNDRAAAVPRVAQPINVTFPATDTTPLHATIVHAKGGVTGRVAILAHQMCKDRSEWGEQAHDWISALTSRGISTLALDLRGHGRSTTFADGSTHDLCKEIEDEAVSGLYANMAMDVRSAVAYARAELNATAIALVGSSIGANSALLAFGSDPELRVVIALSPGINYRNIQPGPAVAMSKGRKVVLVAAEDDERSADAVRKLAAMGEGVTIAVHETGGHGNSMVKANAGELERLVKIVVEAVQ